MMLLCCFFSEVNKARIKKALANLKATPYKVGESLRPSDYAKIRAGDYRAIFKSYNDKNEGRVLFIGHRNVCDDFSKAILPI
ncbi:MAG: type II toxin-antitoxin system RelE/ParE family toxin [Candidatus Bathyarchaeota archaeon]|nr:type II toxin-antitoxin system RelE/ParE family toxin [Candidatus Bathyarchaeota archaeon]